MAGVQVQLYFLFLDYPDYPPGWEQKYHQDYPQYQDPDSPTQPYQETDGRETYQQDPYQTDGYQTNPYQEHDPYQTDPYQVDPFQQIDPYQEQYQQYPAEDRENHQQAASNSPVSPVSPSLPHGIPADVEWYEPAELTSAGPGPDIPFITYTEQHNPWQLLQSGQNTDHLYRSLN